MIDTHVHLLPQIDDGPQNFPEALALVKAFKTAGYHHLISTSHYWQGYWQPSRSEIEEKVKILNKAIADLNWNIKIYPGAEIRITPLLFEHHALNSFSGLNNSRYYLVDAYPDINKEVILQLQYLVSKKIVPVLAHPERYPLLDEKEQVKRIKSLGVLFQLTTMSIVEKDKTIQNRARLFLDKAYYDLIGSDSHDVSKHFYPLTKIERLVRLLIGSAKWELLTQTNCAKILNNEII